jgi:small subunit ribosomal protein S8
MTDPISDLLTRVRNANRALRPEVVLSYSKLKESVALILKREGYLADCQVEGKAPRKLIKLKLKFQDRKGIIVGLRRVSKPGLRHYVGATEIPRVLGGLGTAIVSTPRGVMSGTEARKQNVGGEVLCYVW